MKNCFTLITLFFAVTSLQAQTTGKAVRQAVKSATTSSITRGTLSRYSGVTGAVMEVDYYLTRAALQAQTAAPNVPTTTPVKPQRSWLEQQQRNYKAWQLKRVRRQNNIKNTLPETENSTEALPALLPDQAFEVSDLASFLPIPKQMPRPQVPFAPQAGTLAYRGLALAADGESIKNILTNGLRLQDAGEENSTLRLAYASHGGYAAMRHILENPVTNITYGPKSAASWGAGRLTQNLSILTVVKIRGTWEGASYEVVTNDIPASQIEEMIVRINLEGNLTWCKIELTQNGNFLLTPYEPNYSVEK